MHWLCVLPLTVTALIGNAMPAAAIWLTERGGTAYLSGGFELGDDGKFRAFLDQPREQPLRVLYLSSHGGKLKPAFAIARMVRRAGLATAVDAEGAVCSSACTIVFAGGVRRHYVNGDKVFEGLTSRTGLGFHPAHRDRGRIAGHTRSEPGTDRIRAFYAEMGMPGAVQLMEKAAIDTLFRPNGRTALDLRIATSLAAP